MANVIDMRILQEGPRNAIVKLTGYLDSGDVNEQSVINIAQFVNNDQQLYLVGFRVDTLEWSMSTGLEIMLQWNSNNPQQILPISGRGNFCEKRIGGLLPDRTIPGYDGSINLITMGASFGSIQFAAGQIANFSVVLDLVKLYNVRSPVPGVYN